LLTGGKKGGLPGDKSVSFPVVPEGLWSGHVRTAGAFCTLNSVSHQHCKSVIMTEIMDFGQKSFMLSL